jgi:hypothetical protein
MTTRMDGARDTNVSRAPGVFFCISFYFTNIIYSKYNTRQPTQTQHKPTANNNQQRPMSVTHSVWRTCQACYLTLVHLIFCYTDYYWANAGP